MASRTIKLKYEKQDLASNMSREILCISKDSREICYQYEDSVASQSASTDPVPETTVPTVSVAAPVIAAPVVEQVVAVPDEPLKAIEALQALVAQGLKKPLSDVPLSKSFKDLVGGKSTLQNELLGSVRKSTQNSHSLCKFIPDPACQTSEAEFGSAPDKAEEMPMEELGSAFQSSYNGKLGKHTNGLISRLMGSKMPGGFGMSAVKNHLSKSWGLGPARIEGVLLTAVTMEPSKRLGGESEAKSFLDSVVHSYAQRSGITLSQTGVAAGSGGGTGVGGATINSEEFEKFQTRQDFFVSQQVEVLMRYLNKDSRDGHRLHDVKVLESLQLQNQIDAIRREHGQEYIQGIQPVFDPLKARHFDSAWNWVRQSALEMFFDMCVARVCFFSRSS